MRYAVRKLSIRGSDLRRSSNVFCKSGIQVTVLLRGRRAPNSTRSAIQEVFGFFFCCVCKRRSFVARVAVRCWIHRSPLDSGSTRFHLKFLFFLFPLQSLSWLLIRLSSSSSRNNSNNNNQNNNNQNNNDNEENATPQCETSC